MAARTKAKRGPYGLSPPPLPPLPEALALRRKIKVKQAAALVGMHEDTYRKNFGHTIIHLGPRLDVVELGVALSLGQPKASVA
jgi:hypothetical protein